MKKKLPVRRTNDKSVPLTEDDVTRVLEALFVSLNYVVKVSRGRQRGFDLSADSAALGKKWRIEAKGGADTGVDKSNVAFHGVAAALLTVLDWCARPELRDCSIGIALPASRWFKVHAAKARATLSYHGVTIFWVSGDKRVAVEKPESSGECVTWSDWQSTPRATLPAAPTTLHLSGEA